MNGRRVEYPHHSPEQVRAYLSEALVIVAELELDDELLPLAFSKAVDLLAAKSIQVEQVMPGAVAMAMPKGL